MLCPVCDQELVDLDGRFRCSDRHGCMIQEGAIIQMMLKGYVSKSLSDDPPVNSRKGEIDCPNCGAPMDRHHYKDTNARVDSCTNCDFMWFDKGELRKVLVETRL